MAGSDDFKSLRVQQALQRHQVQVDRQTKEGLDLKTRRDDAHNEYLKAKTKSNIHDPRTVETTLNRYTDYEALRDKFARYSEQQDSLGLTRLRTALYSAISDEAIRTDVSQYRQHPSTRQEAYGLAARKSFDPSTSLSRAQRGLELVHQKMSMFAEDPDMGSQERMQDMRELAKRAQYFTKKIAAYETAGQIRHRQGRDEEGTLRRAESAISYHEKLYQGQVIQEGVSEGKYGKLKDVQKRQVEVGELLNQVQNELITVGKDEIKRRKELLGKLDELSKETSENAQVMAEMKRQGTGGGFGGRAATIAGSIGVAMQIGRTMGSAYSDYVRYSDVGSEMQLLDVRTGYAGLANRQYQDMRGMARGDMASAFRVLGGAWRSATDKGGSLKEAEISALNIDIESGGVGVLGNLVTSTAVNAAVGGRLGGTLGAFIGGAKGFVQGLGGAASDISAIAQNSVGLSKNIPQSQVEIETTNKYLNMFTEMNAMQAQQAQNYVDTSISFTGALRGVGGGRRFESAVSGAMDAQSTLANLGIDKTATLQTFTGLKQALGANFGTQGMEAATRAAQYSARGYLESPQQYAQILGQVSAVGGGNKELGDILKAAIAAGLDTSKNIMQMTSSITSIAAKDATAGLNTTAGAVAAMSGVMPSLISAGVDPNLQATASQSIIETMQQSGSNFGMKLEDLYGLQSAARAGIRDPGKATLYAATTITQWEEMRAAAESGDIKKLKSLAYQRGIEDKITEDMASNLAFIDIGAKERKVQEVTESMIIAPKAFDEYHKAIRSGKTPSKDVIEGVGLAKHIATRGQLNRAGLVGYLSNEELDMSAAQKIIDEVINTKSTTEIGGIVGGAGSIVGAGSLQDIKEQEAGKRQVGDINNLGATLKQMVEKVDWSVLAKQAGEAANKLNVPMGELSGTVNSLNTVLGKTVSRLENLVDKMNNSGLTGSDAPISADAMTQVARARMTHVSPGSANPAAANASALRLGGSKFTPKD
jgi:ABC-type transporter Mla subunit MlaD